jgi:GTP pyrophosphokinase
MLERELKRHNVSLPRLIKEGTLQQVAEETKHSNIDGLFIALGYGKTTVTDLLVHLAPGAVVKDEPSMLGRIFRKVARRSSGGVVVQGLDDVLVRFGKCCSPLPGDSICGFVTRGRGITVHTSTCTRAIDMDPGRKIEVSWDERGTVARPVTIRITTEDRPGMLAMISQVFMENGVNISQANCKVTAAARAVNTFEILIKDKDQLRKVLGKIKSSKGVLIVERV